jgi:transposase
MVHCRRRFYEIHQAIGSPLAEEALRRIGELYTVETEIRGRSAEERHVTRQKRSKPLVEALHAWLTILEQMVAGRTKSHALDTLLPWAWRIEWLAATGDA